MIFNDSKYNSNWNIKKLNQLGNFNRGKSKHRPRNDRVLFVEGIYPLIQTGEIREANLYIRKHTEMYNDFGLKQSKLWPENTLCITIAANIAETALLGYPMCFPDSVVGFNAYPKESSEIFMHYVFTYFKTAIQNSASGSIQDNINIEYLTGLTFKVPEKIYQDKIVAVLYALDSKIELNQRINAELESMTKLLYDYWFVQFDFPNTKGEPYKTSGGKMVWNEELKREIPEVWEVKKINSKIKIGSGFPFKTAQYDDGGKYKIITIKSVQKGYLDTSKADKINFIPENLPDFCKLKKGDVLMSLTGNVGRMCFVDQDNLLLNQRVGKLLADINYIYYGYLYFERAENQKRLEKIANGSSQSNLSPIDAVKDYFIIPKEEVLLDFSKIINPIFKKLLNIHEENQKLAELRDWLLPMLMTGQVTVNRI